jgi:hypothetical protein
VTFTGLAAIAAAIVASPALTNLVELVGNRLRDALGL